MIWELHQVRAIDGDTVEGYMSRELELDEQFRMRIFSPEPQRIRLVTLDTPERGEAGYAQARVDVQTWVGRNLESLNLETYGFDGFGRRLGDVFLEHDRGSTLTQHMLGLGWLPWQGRR